jgi:putative flippase GtrA
MEVPVIYRQPATAHFDETKRSLRKLALELFGYGIASAVALGVDMGILKALVSWVGWNYLVAATISFTAGAVVAYILSVRLAFGSRRVTNRSIELLVFVALGIVGLVVNAAVIWACVSLVGLVVLQAKLVAAVGTFLTNFTLRRALLFTPSKVKP